MDSVYVGIDPSITNTGVVCLDSTGRTLLTLDGKVKADKSDDIARYKAQTDLIVEALRQYSIESIAYEDYSFDSVHRAYSLAEYGGILKYALREVYAGKLLFVAPTQNKKFACGNGNADKRTIRTQAYREDIALVEQQASTDICDAYFLAKIAWYQDQPETAFAVDSGNPHLRTRMETIRKIERNSRNG